MYPVQYPNNSQIFLQAHRTKNVYGYGQRPPRSTRNHYARRNAISNPEHNVLKLFSEQVTMHGFRELYESKSNLWKVIWFLILVFSVGIATFQLYNLFYAVFHSKSTTTVIQPLDGDVEYPPLKICYLHWLYWINWTAAAELGFDRNSTIFAMSYQDNVVSLLPFNITETTEKFKNTMKKNNMKSILQFFSAVAFSNPPGITVPIVNWKKWKRTVRPSWGYLCYVASAEMISTGLMQRKKETGSTDNILDMYYDKNLIFINNDTASTIEYKIYVKAFIESQLRKALAFREIDISAVNKTNFIAAPILNVDNVRVNIMLIIDETYLSHIHITGQLHKWIGNDKRPCTNEKTGSDYEFCDKLCMWKEVRKNNPKECLELAGAELLKEETIEKVCRHNITFLSNRQTSIGNWKKLPDVQPTTLSFNSCIDHYCKMPCKQWVFASTTSDTLVPKSLAKLGFRNKILVEYPSPVSVMVFTEVNTYTWQTVVSNTGGIVALWFGGSIITIIQMVYLFCYGVSKKLMSVLSQN